MGRIDQAMSRANMDAGRGTGAEAPAPAPSPWQIEARDGGEGAGTQAASTRESAGAAPAGRVFAPEGGRATRWNGFAPEALERLVASKDAGALMVEQFRSLAGSLHRAQAERQLRSLIVTSASPGDGKSHVSINVALTLADSYRRTVLLIDADLRRPTLHHLFRVNNPKGLSEALDGVSEEHAAVVPITDRLTFLPAGRSEANPLGGLSSGRMKRLVAEASARYDWVIVDTPPVGVLADAHLVAETVDAALLVIRAGVTQLPDVAAAADKLGRERILGVVLNAVDPNEIRGQHYYHHYYGSGAKS